MSLLGVVGAGLALGGGIYSAFSQSKAASEANSMNLQIAREQMGFSAAQAQKQMDFQERMSGSAYQRAVADMRAAGINPMFAADNGGASAPSGAMASSAGATMLPVPPVVSNLISGAKDMVQTYASLRQAYATTRNIDADTVKKAADTARSINDANLSTAKKKALEVQNASMTRQLEAEKNWPKVFGWLDAIFSRVPVWGLFSGHGSRDINIVNEGGGND